MEFPRYSARRSLLARLLLLFLIPAVMSCSRRSPATDARERLSGTEPPQVPLYSYRVVHAYPHDPAAFTQGLVFRDGCLYEGTGLYGRSDIRQVELETGRVLRSVPLDGRYFGEGIVVVGDRLIQLTWRGGVGLIYRMADFAKVGQFRFPTEGWGLTYDGEHLIASDGTATLYRMDPHSMAVVDRFQVQDVDGPVTDLNELEWVAGEIFANVWQTDRIARISPYDGQVTGWIDLTGLLPPRDRTREVDVLNGIAYDAAGGRLFVTGKLWPKLFEIELVPADRGGAGRR